MPTLTRYESFEALKAVERQAREITAEEKKRLAEFEQFLKMLQRNFSNTKINGGDNGKQSR